MAQTGRSLAELLHAMEFAADKHRDQRRKGADASPYINHPIQVACVLAHEAGVEDLPTLMAAVLHDTVEDTATTFEELESEFGKEVCRLVAEVTDDKTLEKAERKRLQVEHAPRLTDRAREIKLADKICNVRDIGRTPPLHWDEVRRLEYFDWAMSVVDGCRSASPRLARLFDSAIAEARLAVRQANAADAGSAGTGADPAGDETDSYASSPCHAHEFESRSDD